MYSRVEYPSCMCGTSKQHLGRGTWVAVGAEVQIQMDTDDGARSTELGARSGQSSEHGPAGWTRLRIEGR